jgi:HAMP domain-containing protein
MRLLIRFSLVYVLVFGVGIGVAAFIFYDQLQRSAREQVLHQARILMETALAMRNYTTEQVRPAFNDASQREDEVAGVARDLCARRAALRAEERRAAAATTAATAATTSPGAAGFGSPTLISTVAREESDAFRDLCARRPAARVFRPQTVPAFAATEIFNYLSKKYPEYVYKEATLNPTNPRDRAVDWEEDIIKAFRNRTDLPSFEGERTSSLGLSFYQARPLRAGKSCLECHSVPAAAPPEMVALYGTANGFGWKEGEVIGAQIVSVPVAVSTAIANRAYGQLLTSLIAVAALTLVLLDLVLLLTVIRPISRLAVAADDLSRGNMEAPELAVNGRDEVAVLTEAFNRMRRSLAAAMKLLDKP